MLHFYQGSTATVFLTLSDLVTLETPHFLFVFQSRVTGTEIKAVLEPTSTNARAEQFDIDIDTLFANAPLGQYEYHVYEQEDAENMDPDLATQLETGLAHLHRATAFTYTQRVVTTNFIQP